MHFRSALFLSLVGLASATPFTRQSFQTLTTQQISCYSPYTYYASAVKCGTNRVMPWNCGVNCQANPNFEIFDAGGDGNAIQFWFVGYDPDLDTVIVAHQATNTSQPLADLTDLNLFLGHLDPSLFPGVSNKVLVHQGFSHEHSLTASQVLNAVQRVISDHGTSSVTTVGQSLGAALSLLESMYLRLQLPSTISVEFVGYGLPRVGNQAWANLVDAKLSGNITHINNKKDPVPTVPGESLGYHHPSGEIHIEEAGDWVVCPGQDNPSTRCIVGTVPNILVSNETDHDGPYNGIMTLC